MFKVFIVLRLPGLRAFMCDTGLLYAIVCTLYTHIAWFNGHLQVDIPVRPRWIAVAVNFW